MGFQDYISEMEAVAFAGVSINTLNRFSDTGYLQIERDSDGLRLFSRSELAKLFGIKQTPLKEHTPEEGMATKIIDIELGTDKIKTVNQNNTIIHDPLAQEGTEETSFAEEISEVVAASKSEPKLEPETSFFAEPTRITESESYSPSDQARIDLLEQEVIKFKNISDLQERILDMREDEITDLKQQRTWLQERIEKLEEKNQRDQLLLLSETQTIRRLVAYQESKKSTLRLALDWLGFSKPGNTSSTIEMESDERK